MCVIKSHQNDSMVVNCENLTAATSGFRYELVLKTLTLSPLCWHGLGSNLENGKYWAYKQAP